MPPKKRVGRTSKKKDVVAKEREYPFYYVNMSILFTDVENSS